MTLRLTQETNDLLEGNISTEGANQVEQLQVTTYEAITDEQMKRIKEVRDRFLQKKLIRIKADREYHS